MTENQDKQLKSKILINYRNFQSKILDNTLKAYYERTMKKYGSFDNIVKTGFEPLESKLDYNVIKRLIDNKNFVIVPVFKDNKILSVYTIGLWYYWGIPEIILSFDKEIKSELSFIHVFINILYDNLFSHYKDRIISDNNINRLDYSKEDETVCLELEEYNLNIEFNNIKDNGYIDLKADLMLWFYMYYMKADIDEDKCPKMYPVYQLKLNENNFNQIMKKIEDQIVDISSESELSSLSSLSDDFEKLDINDNESIDNNNDETNVQTENIKYKIKFKNLPS